MEKELNEIFYHILAWHLDEGDYQPTEEEAREKVRQIIEKLLESQKRQTMKEIEKARKKWTLCKRKNCDNKIECERANHYIETIWNPTFEELKSNLQK